MTEIPALSKEAKEWLVCRAEHYGLPHLLGFIMDMPLTTDPLAEVRAKWTAPEGYEITAANEHFVYGFYQREIIPSVWRRSNGDSWSGGQLNLIPTHPHAELIREAKEWAERHHYDGDKVPTLVKRLADALEAMGK